MNDIIVNQNANDIKWRYLVKKRKNPAGGSAEGGYAPACMAWGLGIYRQILAERSDGVVSKAHQYNSTSCIVAVCQP
jgi:hypothetical protein